MKCELMPGIASISGSFKGKNDTRVVFKTYRAPSTLRGKKAETRVYFMRKQERQIPLSDKEKANRTRFTAISDAIRQLSEEQRLQYAREWKAAGYKFNGKKYNTLRGYIMARMYKTEA